jgi:hypothetical protein
MSHDITGMLADDDGVIGYPQPPHLVIGMPFETSLRHKFVFVSLLHDSLHVQHHLQNSSLLRLIKRSLTYGAMEVNLFRGPL